MDRKTNIDSIRALEEQIRDHERAVIKLKRTRNSLLNVSKLLPEVLGEIFHWNVTLKGDFDGLDKESHNFLLVCHRWFEVASRTPEIWSFWGSTPEDWGRWCRHLGTAPLDLVLNVEYCDVRRFTARLRNVLQDRVTQDTTRSLHLASNNSKLLHSIIASLISNRGQELRSNRIESFILRNRGGEQVDISNFFSHYYFPKLRCLDLTHCTISLWDHLPSETSVLTTLVLDLGHHSPTPTTSQLLSILTSNPSLRKVGLLKHAVPDGGGGSSFRVQLHHLKELRLEGDLRHVFRFLHQLDHPRTLDNLSLALHNCDLTDVSQIIGPYLREHFQRRHGPQTGLKVYASGDSTGGYHIKFKAGDAGGIDFSDTDSGYRNMFVEISTALNGSPLRNALERTVLDLITYAPLEEVIYLHVYNNPAITENTHTQFPNLRALVFNAVSLSTAFPGPNLIADRKVFPSLEYVMLKHVGPDRRGGWSPLKNFLARRVSLGNRLDTLEIIGSHMCQEVEEDVRGMVRELTFDSESRRCPFRTCPKNRSR